MATTTTTVKNEDFQLEVLDGATPTLPDTNRPCTNPDGGIWPADICPQVDKFFCRNITKERLEQILQTECLQPSDGMVKDIWILTKIDHWDHDQECTICLTDKYLILISLNFITEKLKTVQRVPLTQIHTLRIGNLVSPQWSWLPDRAYGAIQIVWGPLKLTKWKDRWNPKSINIPAIILHHHPCFYAPTAVAQCDLFDCNPLLFKLKDLLAPLAVDPVHENIVLGSRFNPLNVVYNQSRLGFCLDRNGVSF